jgi:outer membrane protein
MIRALMRSKFLFAVVILGGAGTAHADLLRRVFDDAPPGAGATPAPTPPTPLDDLATWAGTPEPTTLPALLASTMKNAPSLASAQFDIAIAEAQIEETWGRNDWRLQGSLVASRSTGGILNTIPVDHSTAVDGSFDVIRALPTGGTVDLHAASSYSNATLAGLPNQTQWFDAVAASVTQPLLRGRGRQLFDANEKKARINRDVTTLARRLAAINAVQAVVSSYWDLVLAERQIAITQQSLDLAKERLRVTTLGTNGGKIAKAEIPAVEQIIATREEDVLSTELAILDRSIALRRAAGLPVGAGALGLRVATDFEISEAALPLAELIERAYAASPELAQLARLADSDTIDIAVTENGLLPQLDAALSLGPTGQDAKFGTALKNLVELDQFAVTGSLTYSQTIGNHAINGRSKEIRLQREKRKVTAFDLRAQIAQSMARSVAQLELAKRRIALSRRAIELANQNIQIETDRFNLGKSTNFDVLNRLEELRQAELREAQAKIDWHKAEAVVVALTGEILPRYGVTLD